MIRHQCRWLWNMISSIDISSNTCWWQHKYIISKCSSLSVQNHKRKKHCSVESFSWHIWTILLSAVDGGGLMGATVVTAELPIAMLMFCWSHSTGSGSSLRLFFLLNYIQITHLQCFIHKVWDPWPLGHFWVYGMFLHEIYQIAVEINSFYWYLDSRASAHSCQPFMWKVELCTPVI